MIAGRLYLISLFAAAATLNTDAFVVSSSSTTARVVTTGLDVGRHHFSPKQSTSLGASDAASSADDTVALSSPEQKVYDIVADMHGSSYPFRLVVVGNGAILETTSELGPTFKLGKSPRTGEPLTTFASIDQSFEFHLMIAQVSKIVMTAKENPAGKLMQIFRFLTDEGKPMCSLILADKGDEASAWFGTMVEKYDQGDVQL